MSAKSITTNRELMSQARATLRGNWTEPVLITLAYLAIVCIFHTSLFSSVALLLFSGPIAIGFSAFYLSAVRKRNFLTKELGRGISQLASAFLSWLLMSIFIILWSLLLIVPGFIAALSYSMVFFIRCDRPELTALDALKRSKELMRGNRWKLFCLICRFIGWALLAILTLGIGFLWLIPYWKTSQAHFYEDLLRNQQATSG